MPWYENSFPYASIDCLPYQGHYLTEQTMAFCQIVLKRSLVENVINDPYDLGWTEKVKEHKKRFPKDPLPFPFNDPDPQVCSIHER